MRWGRDVVIGSKPDDVGRSAGSARLVAVLPDIAARNKDAAVDVAAMEWDRAVSSMAAPDGSARRHAVAVLQRAGLVASAVRRVADVDMVSVVVPGVDMALMVAAVMVADRALVEPVAVDEVVSAKAGTADRAVMVKAVAVAPVGLVKPIVAGRAGEVVSARVRSLAALIGAAADVALARWASAAAVVRWVQAVQAQAVVAVAPDGRVPANSAAARIDSISMAPIRNWSGLTIAPGIANETVGQTPQRGADIPVCRVTVRQYIAQLIDNTKAGRRRLS